jgi:hypothetical protein
MLQMKVLTLEASENIATTPWCCNMLKTLQCTRTTKPWYYKWRHYNLMKTFQWTKNIKAQCYKWRCVAIKVQEIEMNNGQANLTTLWWKNSKEFVQRKLERKLIPPTKLHVMMEATKVKLKRYLQWLCFIVNVIKSNHYLSHSLLSLLSWMVVGSIWLLA